MKMKIPEWYSEHAKEAEEFITRLEPFPFNQPSDISRYVSLHQNDYLRLGNHPKVIEARALANDANREEAFMSTVFGGGSNDCEVFRNALSASMQAEDTMLTTSGWAANVGLIEAITPLFKPVYIDSQAHASLYDGIKLSLGKKVVIKHNETEHLLRSIEKNGPGIVAIDAVYSTDGSIGDIERYVEICEQHDCILILDEAHSFGLFGNGGGLAVELGLADRVHFRTVSVNKALGGHGGFITGGEAMMKLVRTRCRSIIFSSATSSVSAAGHVAALQILVSEPERAKRCMDSAAEFRRRLDEIGVDYGDSQCQIVSIFFEGEQAACTVYDKLRKRGILTSVFLYPAIPLGISLVRFSVHSELTGLELDKTVESVREVLTEIGMLKQTQAKYSAYPKQRVDNFDRELSEEI